MCVCVREGIRKARKKSCRRVFLPIPAKNARSLRQYPETNRILPEFRTETHFLRTFGAKWIKILSACQKVSKNGLKMRKRKKRSRSPALSSKSNLISCVSENPAPSGKTVSPRTRCPSTRTRPQNLSYPAYLCSRKIFRPPTFASRIFRPLTSSMSSGTASS